jgi:alkylation response protein AidB-like acyl-CoA dehydrogenase
MNHKVKYAKERQAFGKPIAEFQEIQFKLAEMATEAVQIHGGYGFIKDFPAEKF